MIFILTVCVLTRSFIAAGSPYSGSCPLVNPPLNLATGALDQLFDTVLSRLLLPQSVVLMEQSFDLGRNINVSNIHVYQMDSIRRNCPIRLTTHDSLGCSQRGLTLKACIGADELQIKLQLNSTLPGFKKGRYIITLPKVTTNMTINLFSPAQQDTSARSGRPGQAINIVEIKTEASNKMKIKIVEGNILQRAVSSIIPVIVDLISSRLLKILDSYVLDTLNDKLSQFHLDPLFITQSEADSQERHLEEQDDEDDMRQKRNKNKRVKD